MCRIFLFTAVAAASVGSIAAADAHEPIRYSLDELDSHPYSFYPSYGHASQSPGSPKYFVPGYGYRIPGFGFRGGYAETLNPDVDYYRFGRRDHGFYTDERQRYWTNSYGGPWYHAGWPANTRTAWPGW